MSSGITFIPYLIVVWSWAVAIFWSVLSIGCINMNTVLSQSRTASQPSGVEAGRQEEQIVTEWACGWIGVWAPRTEQWIRCVGAGRSICEDDWHFVGSWPINKGVPVTYQTILKQEKQWVLCHERARHRRGHHCSWRIEFTWDVVGNQDGEVMIS